MGKLSKHQFFKEQKTKVCLGRGNSLYPNLPVQMGFYSPINLYGTKGRENKLLYGPFSPR